MSIILRPFLRLLNEFLAIFLVFSSNSLLDRIVGVRLDQQLSHVFESSVQSRIGLPLAITKNAKAHATFVVVGHVGVVDLGLPVDRWRLERVLDWEADENLEFSSLRIW